MEPCIVDWGRGPSLGYTRLTVYDVLDHLRDGWEPEAIAQFFHVTTEMVQAAVRYIEEHQDEVMAAYQQMRAFAAQGNSPEVRALLEANRPRIREKMRQIREAARQGGNGAGDPGRYQCGGALSGTPPRSPGSDVA